METSITTRAMSQPQYGFRVGRLTSGSLCGLASGGGAAMCARHIPPTSTEVSRERVSSTLWVGLGVHEDSLTAPRRPSPFRVPRGAQWTPRAASGS